MASMLRQTLRLIGAKLHVSPDDARRLPGDELLSDARLVQTHAIDIDAPPESVWPWLVQMGCRRAGWYGWDAVDNGGAASAERVIPSLQRLAIGDILAAAPDGGAGFAVLRLEPARALVLGSPSLLPYGHSWDAPYLTTWAFVLEPIGAVRTHLIARLRAAYRRSAWTMITGAAAQAAHAFMERRQLRAIKQRAEAS